MRSSSSFNNGNALSHLAFINSHLSASFLLLAPFLFLSWVSFTSESLFLLIRWVSVRLPLLFGFLVGGRYRLLFVWFLLFLGCLRISGSCVFLWGVVFFCVWWRVHLVCVGSVCCVVRVSYGAVCVFSCGACCLLGSFGLGPGFVSECVGFCVGFPKGALALWGVGLVGCVFPPPRGVSFPRVVSPVGWVVFFSLGWLVSCPYRGWFFRFSVACLSLSLGGLCFCLVWLPVVHVVVSSPLRGVAGVLVLSFVGSARWGHEH